MMPFVGSSSLNADFKNGENLISRSFASYICLLEIASYNESLLKLGFNYKNSLSDFKFFIISFSIVLLPFFNK